MTPNDRSAGLTATTERTPQPREQPKPEYCQKCDKHLSAQQSILNGLCRRCEPHEDGLCRKMVEMARKKVSKTGVKLSEQMKGGE